MDVNAVFAQQYRAWERFFATGQIDTQIVRDEVARSWIRCHEGGIDPRAPRSPLRKAEDEIARVIQSNNSFIEAALPCMRFLQSVVRGTGFLLVLTDDAGIVLEVFGDDEVIGKARDNNYMPGCCRSESETGTNAIGLALIERNPVQLCGPEHYNLRHHDWACASAPVFSSEGTLLGTVTLSGRSLSVPVHTLGMVVAAAEAIQNRLREQKMEAAKLRDEQLIQCLLKTASDAIITLNGAGKIVHVNRVAETLLGRTEASLYGADASAIFSGTDMTHMLDRSEGSPFELAYEMKGHRDYFIAKPFIMREADQVIGTLLAISRRRDFLKHVGDMSGFAARYHLRDLVGRSPVFRRQIELAEMVAKKECRVLITGETGTGKELLVQGIHNASLRASGPFVAINCAALPRELFEAELFGYKEGAFTSARRGGQIGKFELADGGTLFLDEISQIPLDMQAKLLRVLQDGIVTRLGDNKPIAVDVRVIAATNEDLFEKSQHSGFRQDLYFRLSAVELLLPPLRERDDDVVLVTEAILERLRKRLDRPSLRMSALATDCLRRYEWPGNIRELENVLEMAATLSKSEVLHPENLPARVSGRGQAASRSAFFPVRIPDENEIEERRPVIREGDTMRGVEADVIRQALRQHNGKITKVSRELGMSRSTIYRRMREIGIDRVVKIVGNEDRSR